MPPKLSALDADDLVRRYLVGESTKQLGPAFGISSRVVSDYLRRAGVPARTHKEAAQIVAEQGRNFTPEMRSASSIRLRQKWDNATEEERRQMVNPAHDAVRGTHPTEETRCKIAATNARFARSHSPYEVQFAEWLRERHVPFAQQAAIGRYNVDFAVGNVAVELTTGWAHKKQWSVKLAYLFDHGWHFYAVWHDARGTFLPTVADDLVAWMKLLETTPAMRSQHRVVWCSRQVLSTGSADAEDVAAVFKSKTPLGDWPLYDSPGN